MTSVTRKPLNHVTEVVKITLKALLAHLCDIKQYILCHGRVRVVATRAVFVNRRWLLITENKLNVFLLFLVFEE